MGFSAEKSLNRLCLPLGKIFTYTVDKYYSNSIANNLYKIFFLIFKIVTDIKLLCYIDK